MSKAELTKQFIIEKTAPIFNKKGYAGTSLSDMTEATGLTKGSIYGNFSDKDEVAVACFDHNTKKVSAIIRAEMDKRSNWREKLMVYADVYGNPEKYAFPAGGCPILNTTIDADDTHEGLRVKVGQFVTNWKDRIVFLIQEGITSGEFSNETDVEAKALTLIALLEGALFISRATRNTSWRKAVISSVEKLIREL